MRTQSARILTISFSVCFLALQLAATPGIGQQTQPLLDPEIWNLLHEELSGELAKEYVIDISRHHRIQGSRGYRDAAQYVLEQLSEFGFSEPDALVESYPSDGRAQYQTWQSPSGWDIDWAELRMVEPYDERIVGYPEIAMSLITYSNPGSARAELVWVGSGTSDADYEGKDVAGKIVLATGYGGDVHRNAVLKHGALAVVCYLDDDRAKEYPDIHAYTGMWPRTEELEHVTFGFNISNRQGERLRDLLLAGERVVLDGRVEGIGLEPYFMDIVVARIPGAEKPEEHLVFSAHLDHPKESANDNASGSAALMDIARSLRRLIDTGRLPEPERSLLFLWVPEHYGTMAYIDGHPEMVGPALGGSYLANLNLDMVGENLELLHSKMIITGNPDSLPTVFDAVLAEMAAAVAATNVRTARGSLSEFNYRNTPYSGGSDHTMFIDRKIPASMINHSPDYTHHTTDDTLDKVDPVELERSELLAAATFWYLANLDSEQALDLASLAYANSSRRLGAAARRAQGWVKVASPAELPSVWAESQNVIDASAQHEMAALESVLQFNDAEAVRQQVSMMKDALGQQHDMLGRALRAAVVAKGHSADEEIPSLIAVPDSRVPVRITRGPLGAGIPESALSDSRLAWYGETGRVLSGTIRFELVNFIDGQRSVSEIRNMLAAEFGPIDQIVVAHYLEDLVTASVAEWR
jgi:hypothetical protein